MQPSPTLNDLRCNSGAARAAQCALSEHAAAPAAELVAMVAEHIELQTAGIAAQVAGSSHKPVSTDGPCVDNGDCMNESDPQHIDSLPQEVRE